MILSKTWLSFEIWFDSLYVIRGIAHLEKLVLEKEQLSWTA